MRSHRVAAVWLALLGKRSNEFDQTVNLLFAETAEPGHVAGTYRDHSSDLLVAQDQRRVRTFADLRADASLAIQGMTSDAGAIVEIPSQEVLVRPDAAAEDHKQRYRQGRTQHRPAIYSRSPSTRATQPLGTSTVTVVP